MWGGGSWCVTLSLFVRCRNNTRCICISPGRDLVVRTQVMCGYADINWLTSWLNMDPCGNTEEMQCSKQTSSAPQNLRLISAHLKRTTVWTWTSRLVQACQFLVDVPRRSSLPEVSKSSRGLDTSTSRLLVEH